MTTNELRAKFEAWWKENYWYVDEKLASLKHYAWMGWLAAHASRDAEVEALKRDAERYRWLRDRAVHFELDDGEKGTPYIVYGLGMGDSEPTWGTEADSIIDECSALDAAMAKEAGE